MRKIIILTFLLLLPVSLVFAHPIYITNCTNHQKRICIDDDNGNGSSSQFLGKNKTVTIHCKGKGCQLSVGEKSIFCNRAKKRVKKNRAYHIVRKEYTDGNHLAIEEASNSTCY